MPFTREMKIQFGECYVKAKALKSGDKLVQLAYTMIDMARKSDMGYEMKVPPPPDGHPQQE